MWIVHLIIGVVLLTVFFYLVNRRNPNKATCLICGKEGTTRPNSIGTPVCQQCFETDWVESQGVVTSESKVCHDCGKVAELRPYGKDRARVCFDCLMKYASENPNAPVHVWRRY